MSVRERTTGFQSGASSLLLPNRQGSRGHDGGQTPAMSCSDIRFSAVTILRSIRLEAMKDWIIIAILYAFGIGFFRLLGGMNAAGEALRRWGRASSTVKTTASSSTS
jgi:hypothetical protein